MPALDAEVDSLLPGPTAGTVYVGGKFATVDGVAQKGIALLNAPPVRWSPRSSRRPSTVAVLDLKLAGSHLLMAGTFTTVKKLAHGGIASLNPTTGALDPFVNIQLPGTTTSTAPARMPASAAPSIAVAPDGYQGGGHRQLQDRRRAGPRPGRR